MQLSKKIIVSLLIFLQVFLLSSSLGASAAKAASIGPWYNQTPAQYYSKVYESGNPSEIFGERYTTAQVDWIIMSVLAWPFAKLFGGDMVVCATQGLSGTIELGPCVSALFSDTSTSPAQEGLALINTADEEQSLVAGIVSDRPISAITYVKNIFRKPQIVPEAEAQGFGYDEALDPVKGMWASVRNFTYFFFVIITIVFAFMIMFRVKLSPQTVITVQSALPKIFIAIILVTFSYAIAGFLIDLMYVVIGILSILLSQLFGNFPASPGSVYANMTQGGGIFGLIILYFIALPLSVVIVVVTIIGGAISFIVVAALAVGVILLGGATGTIGWIIILLIIAILIIWLLYLSLKIIWTLVKAYAMIVLLTVFAPLHIALGLVVPSLGFSRWLKSYVSQLAVFVVVGTLFMLAFVFLVQAIGASQDTIPDDLPFFETVLAISLGTGTMSFLNSIDSGGLAEAIGSWPPMIGLGGSAAVSFLFLATSFVIFTMIPKTADLIKSAVSGQPFSYGAAIGEAFGPVKSLGGAGLQYGTQKYEEGVLSGWPKNAKYGGEWWANVLRSRGTIK